MTGKMIWSVEVYGYTPAQFEAATAGKARYLAFRSFREYVTRLSFREFLARGVKVRRERQS